MPSSATSPARRKAKVEGNLRELRRRGFPNARLDDLTDLVEIARKLNGGASDQEMVEDALGKGIDACWGGARVIGPTLRDAMRLWFGLSAVDNPSTPHLRAMKPSQRHKAAWEYLEGERLNAGEPTREAESTFRTGKADQRYNALAKKLIELEAQSAQSANQPSPEPAAPLDLPPAPADARRVATGRGRSSRRIGLLLIVVGVIVIGLIIWAVWPARDLYANPRSVPPRSAVVNAESGAILFHVVPGRTRTPVELAGGHGVMLACVVATDKRCHYASTLRVHTGDVIQFSVELVDLQDQLIPYLKLVSESIGHGGPNTNEPTHEIKVTTSIQWLSALNEGSYKHTFESDFTQLTFPDTAPYLLAYIPGSTRLLTPDGHLVHTLPNGIMQYGIALQDVGPPPGCLDCSREYTRYINFRTRVAVGK